MEKIMDFKEMVAYDFSNFDFVGKQYGQLFLGCDSGCNEQCNCDTCDRNCDCNCDDNPGGAPCDCNCDTCDCNCDCDSTWDD